METTLKSHCIGPRPQVDLFEQEFARIFELSAVAVVAGTDRLHLANVLADLQPSDEIITNVFICTDTMIPLLYMNVEIKFADVQPNTLNIDPDHMRELITQRTKMIICVHYGGLPCDMQELREIQRVRKQEAEGWFAFSVPNFACWERPLFGRCRHALKLPRHLQHCTPPALRMMLTETSFELVKILHQRNLLNVVGSSGIALRRRFPHGKLGQKLIDFTEQPTMWWQLALAPLAKLLAFVHQVGRLTVIARNRP